MRLKDLWFTLSLLVLPVMVKAEHEKLQKQLQEVIAGKRAQVGIAVILNGRDTVTVNNDYQYPMMSVFKLYQALAVADYCQKEKLSFDTFVYIRQSDLKPDTYSPLRDKYPQGEISLSIKDLLKYTLHLSDNNACDILFAQTVGTKATDKYIRSLGIRDFSIEVTEDEMHKDVNTCYLNWSTPLEAAKVIELLLTRALFDIEYQDFIKRAMITCETGKDRLPFPLEGTKAIIGHKTGTGDLNAKGQIIGINDVGFVYLPNGERYTIAVFIKDSAETIQETSQIIADISRVVYQYISET
ncbi:class A beta-lactamase, subclass A2 [uncultured Sanguibacteroides sp.]|uniref:class A beta-lactamase, subclass A2 n=1 Tax=uncultured Sanguibacteroides sp. TaxID=1635151 RepID=UPI0025DAA2B8|nr:class A beta-lactamase, subclass A2 [uncultured Sanguibacteroides sp.]